MNKLKQHIPCFVDIPGKRNYNFKKTKDLLNLKIVKGYIDKSFSHFAMDDDSLMVINDNGYKWWVIGTIEKPELIDLPKWKGGKYKAILEGKKVILSGDEVMGSSGDILHLKNCRTARRYNS